MDTATIIWGTSLILALVVIGVVTLLLHQIKKTAAQIDLVVGQIWTQGKLTANNTVHIPLFLAKTNQVVSRIYQSSLQIVQGAALIRQHTEQCPACPHCLLKPHKEER